MSLDRASAFRAMLRIRRAEEAIARAYPTDVIKSPIHLSIGQEAVSVGVCAALRPEDVAYGTYRGHALYLAKGGDMRRMIAELYGKATGCAGGKGGSMHLVDVAAGMMGTSAIVGTGLPHAVGHALALARLRPGTIVVAFFGDGAVEEGVFHESLNFAALRRLPILFVCENNGYAIHADQASRQAVGDICALARAHGLPAERHDGSDPFVVAAMAERDVAAIRAGESGPRFLEFMTYRWHAHVGPETDLDGRFRPAEEAQPWLASDAVRRLGEGLPADVRAAIEAEVEAELRDAFAFAEASEFPQPEALYSDVYGGA